METAENVRAYDGSGDFIFVSYAHLDSDEVIPIIEYLLNRGYNVWFDEGIQPGKDWDAFLKEKVETCACFLCFISARSMASDECLKEIERAKEANRPILSIFLEDVVNDIPESVSDYILNVQGIEKWRMASELDAAFYVKLLSTDLFDSCKEYTEFVIQGDMLVRYNGTASVVVVPDEVTQISYDAFEGNAAVSEIRIHGRIDRIGKFAFSDMPNLRRIAVSPENRFFSSDDGVLYNKAHNYLLRYPSARMGSEYIVPDGVANIGIGAFSGAADLKQVSIPASVTMIGDRAFESCRELVGVELAAHIDKLRPYTFSRCANLVGIELPQTLQLIGDGAFSGCSNLLEIDIPKDVSYVGEMAFAYCGALAAAHLPASIGSIEEYCFNECRSLASIELGATTDIKQYAFKNCEALCDIAFPACLERVGRAAFSGCRSLENVTLPDATEMIGAYSFDRCTSLKEVRCGSGLKRIEAGAFEDDTALERVLVPRTIESIADNAIPENASVIFE